jgi:hypothetical protein
MTQLSVPECKAKLAHLQTWLHPETLGVYVGIEDENVVNADYQALMEKYAGKVDYLAIKCYEFGSKNNGLWMDLRQLANDANAAHIGIAPYIFCHPDDPTLDIMRAVECAEMFGGVILDCEEQFIGHGTELYEIVHGVREAVPDAIILISGYGDPVTAFYDGHGGSSWPFDAIRDADGYQPQWYLGWWNVYIQGHNYQRAVQWGDAQCGVAFVQYGLTDSFPISPAMNLVGLNGDDIGPLADYLRANWQASVMVWEEQDITPEILTVLAEKPAPVAAHESVASTPPDGDEAVS